MIFPPCEKPVRILNSCKFHPKNSGAGLRHLATGKVAIGSRSVAGVEVGSLLLANGGICCLGDIGETPLHLGNSFIGIFHIETGQFQIPTRRRTSSV